MRTGRRTSHTRGGAAACTAALLLTACGAIRDAPVAPAAVAVASPSQAPAAAPATPEPAPRLESSDRWLLALRDRPTVSSSRQEPEASPSPAAVPSVASEAPPAAPPPPPPPPTPTSTPSTAPPPDPQPEPISLEVFAVAVDVTLYLPSDQVELVGYHQSNHDGARGMTPQGNRGITMETRDRDTDPRGSADVALPRDTPVFSPVTGRVIRAGTYTLYCEYRDDFLVIEPDDHPGWEVKLLHIDGVRVRAGDRVEAGVTLVAPRATVLPFESQVNEHTRDKDTPHVHIEVVDPSIKDRPSEGGGC